MQGIKAQKDQRFWLYFKSSEYLLNPIEALEFKSPKLTISYRISYGRFGLQAMHINQHAFEVHKAV